jgi:hypothetical protein
VERVVQKNKQITKASFFACCLFVKLFLCKFGALAYEVNIKSIVVRWQKRWKKAWAMSAILHNSSYNDDFFSFKNINAKNCAKRTYNFYYVT